MYLDATENFGMPYGTNYFLNNYACVYLVLFTDKYIVDEMAPYFYWSMSRQKLSPGKNLTLRDIVELSVELKVDKCMLKFSILYLLLYT